MAAKTTGKAPAKPKEPAAPAPADSVAAPAIPGAAQETPPAGADPDQALKPRTFSRDEIADAFNVPRELIEKPPVPAGKGELSVSDIAELSTVKEQARPPVAADDVAQSPSVRALHFDITGRQLREALAFLAPDGTADQLDDVLVISCHPDGSLFASSEADPSYGAFQLTGADVQALAIPEAVSYELADWIESDPALASVAEEVGTLAALVVTERLRQIAEEHHTLEQDDEQTTYQLARASVCYLSRAAELPPHKSQLYWPWHPATYKAESSTRSLIKGLALGLAELHRRERAGMSIA